MHEIGTPCWKWPMQAWLQPMQARISSTRSAEDLFAISGSQIIARVMIAMSVRPSAIAVSASWGWLMRPATMTVLSVIFLTCSDRLAA